MELDTNLETDLKNLKEVRNKLSKAYLQLNQTLQKAQIELEQLNLTSLPRLTEKLRSIEKKLNLVLTLFQSSIYSATLQTDNNKRFRGMSNLETLEHEQEPEPDWQPNYKSNRPDFF